MEPFEEEKKIPDFFETRAQIRSDVDDEDDAENAEQKPMTSLGALKEDDDLSSDEVPYDFRAEYKERIGEVLDEDDEKMEKRFSSVRIHAVGIGILIGVLIALLFSVFLFGSSDNEDSDEPIVVPGSQRPFKVRPTNPGGMDIPDQDKTIYKRMRSDAVDTKVEKFVVMDEEPVRPQVPTREGEILGTPRTMPVDSQEMELEVLSVQENAVQAPIAKSVQPKVPAPVVNTDKVVQAPKEVVKSEPAPVKTATATTTTSPKATKTTQKAKDNNWHVQLISLPSKAGAEKTWPKILKAHSALLSGLPHDVVEVQIKGKGTFYRLRVGSFKDRKDAQDLCDKLKARKQDCALTK